MRKDKNVLTFINGRRGIENDKRQGRANVYQWKKMVTEFSLNDILV